MENIDIVIPWVDDNDPVWRASKKEYSNQASYGGDIVERFREWGLLKYWFRGVEKYAPWVNRIHFITCGHLPAWLNINHPKLHIVNHSDYIPAEYLPTFSANPIELNMHRIEGLSEKFIYFNDDSYIINSISPDDYFSGDVPKSTAGLSIPGQIRPEFGSILLKDYDVINKNFSSREIIRRYFTRFVNPRYGFKRNLQTLLLLPYCTQFFPGFYNAHGPNAFLKSTLFEVWEKEDEELRKTCANRFRSPCDLNQYVFLWWQWCKGLVSPQDIRRMLTYLTVLSPDDQILHTIKNQATPIVVVNDTWCEDFDKKKAVLHEAFATILADKSAFEL